MNALRALAVAGLLSMSALQAHALSVNWGTHGTAELAPVVTGTGQVADTFQFTVDAGTTLSAVAVANNLGSVYHLDNGFVQLFRAEAGPDTMLGMFGFDGTTGQTTQSFASLVAGSYYYLVTGVATGAAGAFYALSSTTVSAVPEPDPLTMFLAGLALAGVAMRHRRRT